MPRRRGETVNLAFVLIAGFNTGADEATELARLFRGVPVRLSVIDVNDPTGEFHPASDEERGRFLTALSDAGHRVRAPLLRRGRHPRGLRHAGLGRARRTSPARRRQRGMRVRLLPAHDPAAIAEAAAILRRGGLVAFPTETVYGLGANALDAAAVARIFAAKARPTFDPLIVHLADRSWLGRAVEATPKAAALLAARFWPGPLTLVLPKAARGARPRDRRAPHGRRPRARPSGRPRPHRGRRYSHRRSERQPVRPREPHHRGPRRGATGGPGGRGPRRGPLPRRRRVHDRVLRLGRTR